MNKDEIKKLKFNRLAPEVQFIYELLESTTAIFNINGDRLYLKNDDCCYFYYDALSSELYYDYRVFDTLAVKYEFDMYKIDNLIRDLFNKYSKLNARFITLEIILNNKTEVRNYLLNIKK